MKKIIALGVIVLSMNTNASCTEDFDKGLNYFEFAMTYFNDGANNYQQAVDESRSQGRRSVICSHLLKSTTGFDVAQKSFSDCGVHFGAAAISCSGESSQIARENSGVCAENTEVATNNYQQIAQLLRNTCFTSEKKAIEMELPEIQTNL